MSLTQKLLPQTNLFNLKPQKWRTKVIEGEEWVCVADICRRLGLRNTSEATKNLPPEDKQIHNLETMGGVQQMLLVSQSGLRKIVSSSRKPQARQLAQELGFECFVSPIEADCLEVLHAAFKHLEPIDQFYVQGYRIDLYFPQQRLAVECDEYGHKAYPHYQEKTRQRVIQKALGCKFVRFNPHKENFNIGVVVNKIIQEIYPTHTSNDQLT